MNQNGFLVFDTKTGEYPDLWSIALNEDWAKGLIYCDMEDFAITEDGSLILMDDCGKVRYCPEGRFKIIRNPNCDGAIRHDEEESERDINNDQQRSGTNP